MVNCTENYMKLMLLASKQIELAPELNYIIKLIMLHYITEIR